ncbi:ankyrin repeat and fibronectin type-III domain-containing protein 1 isoform X2 [Danio rerio]|uniref:Ankyrin repeat and fibronectin type-III domain-containing protein 1 isoform X2 n=2 Tax=Danio rerio TaxID=7955 RepID=A0A8M6YVS9_DANRE|nr:ankyrin repeat and fibronectin type-III domain-containing protein 1-like isoform X2 [Danio rerio]|eukprot:XP_017209464.1 ankyrin repeat and fibronectin type-III domain-containing protein 1-like isoform X2 [Danio rerio]
MFAGSYADVFSTDTLMESLERRLQRPLLAKSRTLPSIPQSPAAVRVQQTESDCERQQRPRVPSSPGGLEACTIPPAGEMWRLEDESEADMAPGAVDLRPRSQSPFSHFRRRAAYLRKSISADDHLVDSEFQSIQTEDRSSADPKAKLKRKFSLGSIDRKGTRQRRTESGIVKLTQRLSLKDKHCSKEDRSLQSRPPAYRRRSLSVDWAESKMTQQIPDPHPLIARKYSTSCSSPPSAARRLYRNLSGKFRTANLVLDDTTLPGQSDKEQSHKTTMFQGNEALFEAVEHQELDVVESLLNTFSLEELDLNTPNSEGLLPLDIAIMTNNVPMAKLLLRAGAKESPHFLSLEGRAAHLASLVQEAEHRIAELVAQVTGEEPGEREESNRERQLKSWEWKLRLYKRMQTGYTHASPPEPPSDVHLCVSSGTSLRVYFQEPLCHNSAVITKYRVSWSSVSSFSPLLGETVIEDVTQLQYDITGLAAGTGCYVQVSAYNMKGWSSPQISEPACATPSSWREVDGLPPRQQGLKEALEQLLGQIKGAHRHCACHEQIKAPSNTRKHSVSKSLRHLFQPTSKFVKNLKRGLYLACIFYQDENVLVTPEDQLPVVEVDDSFSCHAQDLLWFTKVCHLWEELSWMQQCISPAHACSSCTLQTRLKLLQAAAQLQALLGTVDLGQVYFEPIKDKHGNAVLVLLKDMSACAPLEGLRWIPVSKFQLQRRSSSSSSEEPSALETLLSTLHEKLSYHRRSRKCLPPGLYLGYLKLYTSVDQIRVLVSHKHPNVLCHVKIRDNGHVSREEWQWLQSLTSLEDSAKVCEDAQSAPHRLLLDLRTAAKELLAYVNIPNQQAQDFRVYVKEVVELGEGVSFLLLLPPCEEVCSPPGQNHLCSPRSSFFTLPLQIFELVHFESYSPSFISLYCQVSALLALESLMSQQSLREAFSESELFSAKQKHQQVEEYLQHMEELWRDARWMVILQSARYKHQSSGVSLAWIIDFTKETIPEKPASTSSQVDFLPSPSPSPENTRKHTDSHLSDEDNTSDVFLTTDSSEYSSSVTPSTRELDLLPPSPSSFRSPPSSSSQSSPRSSQPDVLQPVSRREHISVLDSDFILPSRQIELLRVTEKRTALCVRTSSLEYPPTTPTHTASSNQMRWTRPSSFDLCFSAPEPRPSPVRTLSEDSGVQRLSDPAAGSPHRQCHSTLRVYPQYRTGLPKDTSVKLRVTPETCAAELVRLVVQEMNAVCRHLQKATHQCSCAADQCVPSDVCVYSGEQLQHFGLVLLVEGREKWLQDDFCPLTLQNPWTRGKLCVRFKEYSPLALQYSRATTV